MCVRAAVYGLGFYFYQCEADRCLTHAVKVQRPQVCMCVCVAVHVEPHGDTPHRRRQSIRMNYNHAVEPEMHISVFVSHTACV